MNLSANGAALIAKHEGKVNELYEDPVGHCSIGIGHLVHRGNCDGTEPPEFQRGLSDQEVYDLFIDDSFYFVAAVNELVEIPISQNQFDALVSFAFNVGDGALAESTLLAKLNAGDYSGAADEFGNWVTADGVTLPGLVSRRADERDLFLTEESPIADLEHLHPEFRKRVLATGVSVLSGARSTERQRQLYEDYKAGRGNPANPPGSSWHEYGDGIRGGVWAYAVDFNEPYPHGSPGLIFPIAGEPWHAQPAEISEASRVNGVESRMPVQPVIIPNEERTVRFTYKFKGQDLVYLGAEGYFGYLPFGEFLDRTKKSGDLRDYGEVGEEFHKGAKALADRLGFVSI